MCSTCKSDARPLSRGLREEQGYQVRLFEKAVGGLAGGKDRPLPDDEDRSGKASGLKPPKQQGPGADSRQLAAGAVSDLSRDRNVAPTG